jgi:hypothetical protein
MSVSPLAIGFDGAPTRISHRFSVKVAQIWHQSTCFRPLFVHDKLIPTLAQERGLKTVNVDRDIAVIIFGVFQFTGTVFVITNFIKSGELSRQAL